MICCYSNLHLNPPITFKQYYYISSMSFSRSSFFINYVSFWVISLDDVVSIMSSKHSSISEICFEAWFAAVGFMNSFSSFILKPSTSIDSLYKSSSSSLVGFIVFICSSPAISLSFLHISANPCIVLFNAFSYFFNLFLSFFYCFSAYSIYNGILLFFPSSSLKSCNSSRFCSILSFNDLIKFSFISRSILCLCFSSLIFFYESRSFCSSIGSRWDICALLKWCCYLLAPKALAYDFSSLIMPSFLLASFLATLSFSCSTPISFYYAYAANF